VHLNTEVNEDLINKANPESIIVATGAVETKYAYKVSGNTRVTYLWDYLKGNIEIGKKVVVVGNEAVEAAASLCNEGKSVTLVQDQASYVWPCYVTGGGARREPLTRMLKKADTKFNAELRNYNQEVNDYLGYILIKSLTPNAMINFRKITERSIIKFPFEILREKKAKDYELREDEFIKIKDQFIGEKTYLVMLGDHHFSESLITAEWLYDSMKKAQAIDLTVIGMGYFKAVEQLLFELICLHKNENRCIKGVCVDSDSICDNILDTTIGAMANFYKDNLDILNDDLSWRTRKYIRETIFDYKNLRNGYFHKDNIHNWDKVEKIRIASFSMIFLLLGAQKLTDDDLTQLGMPNTDEFSDYSRLCEYVNFHSENLFFLNLGGKEDALVFGCCDMYSKVVDNKYIKYSGVYFREIGKDGRTVLFREKDLPKDIYLGKFVFDQTEMIDVKPVKVKKIFENGKYIGPSIIEEENFDY
jgi:hypothetical protein